MNALQLDTDETHDEDCTVRTPVLPGRAGRAMPAKPAATSAPGGVVKVPATEAQRRLRRLLGAGYQPDELARALGFDSGSELPLEDIDVPLSLHARIVVLYGDLRLVKAQRSIGLLTKLRHEGYRPAALERAMAEVARAHGCDAPSLSIANGRIPARTERLVTDLYERLTS